MEPMKSPINSESIDGKVTHCCDFVHHNKMCGLCYRFALSFPGKKVSAHAYASPPQSTCAIPLHAMSPSSHSAVLPVVTPCWRPRTEGKILLVASKEATLAALRFFHHTDHSSSLAATRMALEVPSCTFAEVEDRSTYETLICYKCFFLPAPALCAFQSDPPFSQARGRDSAVGVGLAVVLGLLSACALAFATRSQVQVCSA